MSKISENMLTFRLRTNEGLKSMEPLYSNQTIQDLKNKISLVTCIPVTNLIIMGGYPPSVLNCENDTQPLSKLNIKSGEYLTIKNKECAYKTTSIPKINSSKDSIIDNMEGNVITKMEPNSGILIKKVVPADNSCLFTSINFCLTGGVLDLSAPCVSNYRKIISDTVLAFDPMENIKHKKVTSYDGSPYNDVDLDYLSNLLNPAMLDKPNRQYAQWIASHQSWGGAVEIAIFARYFRVEIDVVDIRTCRLEPFGQEMGYPERILLLYDGIHYDPLLLETEIEPGHFEIKTKFSTTIPDQAFILDQARDIAEQARSSHQFTSTSNFTLKCYDCNTFLVGENQAKAHAKQTGHQNFGEVLKKS